MPLHASHLFMLDTPAGMCADSWGTIRQICSHGLSTGLLCTASEAGARRTASGSNRESEGSVCSARKALQHPCGVAHSSACFGRRNLCWKGMLCHNDGGKGEGVQCAGGLK